MAINTKSASPFFALIFLLLLSHTLLSAKAQHCPSFSCGQLQDISYPFRRRDDPPYCGEPLYQLNCQGNKSTFSINSVEYLLTDIRYRYFIVTLHLVDPNFVDGGSCARPAQSLSPETMYSLWAWSYFELWASFMNCSEPIKHKNSGYWPVSCLSSRYTSSFVYVFIARDGYRLQYLPPSCQFISMIPVTDSINVDPLVGNSSQVYYPSWIYDKLNQQQDITLNISFEINELEKKLAIVGLSCIQIKSFDRPTITKVIERLESNVEMISMPPKPFLSLIDSITKSKPCFVSSSTESLVVLE